MADPVVIAYTPGIVHLTRIVQGDTLMFSCFLAYEDDEPYDLDGYDARMQIRRADNSLLHTLSLGDGLEIDANRLGVTVSAAITAIMGENNDYFFDIQLEKDGVIRTIVSGSLDVTRQLTI